MLRRAENLTVKLRFNPYTGAVSGTCPTGADGSPPGPDNRKTTTGEVDGVDPDVVRYLEKLGLRADVYVSNLEAVGLTNGALLDAMRKSVSEARKDKLEKEIQRLGGVSIAEAMVLISGLRNGR